ncbi:MAG: NERD domain-containing protein [Chitinophagaceae bacterium]|nr:NERD domain-containing protein [Chitinophagaceae bacterium]MCW5926595.1 NERD domain-containing protein [Chitinophagaceae bacterium]
MKGYAASRQQIISNSEIAIENEKNNLISDNLQLKESIESTKEKVKNELRQQIEYLRTRLQILSSSKHKNTWGKFISYFRASFLKNKIRSQEQALPSKVLQSVYQSMKLFQKNEERYKYITSKFQDAVTDNCSEDLRTLERKKFLLDEVSSSIYGAIGEQRVVKELERLPDEYVLINDFCLSFSPPIYNRNENDHIKSIQVDHLLIAPSGVFLIETKNWSEQSLNNLSLRSPVSQLKRSSFAVFAVLNKRTEGLGLDQHHWGKKKIAVKNLLVLINQKPLEEFQYVKILTLNQLLSYIKYFPPIFTRRETENITNVLISLSRT